MNIAEEDFEEEKIVSAPKPLVIDGDGNPIDYSYKGMVQEAKDKKKLAEEFKDKIKSIGFSIDSFKKR